MARWTYITYLGQDILFADYTGLRGKDFLHALQETNRHILSTPHDRLLLLADFTNTYIDTDIMAYLSGEEEKASAKKSRKTAVVGVTGIKKIFLNTYNLVTKSGTRAFEDLETAKQYLVS